MKIHNETLRKAADKYIRDLNFLNLSPKTKNKLTLAFIHGAEYMSDEIERIKIENKRKEALKEFCLEIKDYQNCPPEFIEIVNNKFWELL